ncbi:hypothetical protein ACVWZX_000756 [Deinococcus sp. UYEF24]
MPRKTETAAKPRVAKPKTVPSEKAAGAPPKYDWTEVRRQYVRGDDKVTFSHLGTQSGNPTLSAIKKRAGKEKWADLRTEFRNQLGTKVREMDLETIEDVRLRHVGIALAFQTAGSAALASLDLKDLSAFEVVRLMQLGLEAERKARGMEEFTVKIEDLRSPADLKSLTAEQLLELRGRIKARGTA